jgi:hypothetical protein
METAKMPYYQPMVAFYVFFNLLDDLPKMLIRQMVFSEDLGPCVAGWNNSIRTCGCNCGLLKVRKGNTKGSWRVQVETAG